MKGPFQQARAVRRLLKDPDFREGIEIALFQLEDVRQFYLRGPMPRMLDYNTTAKQAIERLRDTIEP